MQLLSLDLVQRTISPRITGFSTQHIQPGASPTRVYRVALEYANGHAGVPAAIVKSIAPQWPDDAHGPDRERRFYTRLSPDFDFHQPHVFHAGIDPETQHRVIVMEDLTLDYVFPPPTHFWTPDEMRCMLRTYARLHVQGQDCVPPPGQRAWLMSRHETRLDAPILGMAEDLVAQGVWSPLPNLDRLLDQTRTTAGDLAGYPVTVLHNDVYPPNVGLPHDLRDEAVLIDWEMAGWGLAEMDLAYVFMQPFGAASKIDRRDALRYYWTQREMLEGRLRPFEERLDVQRHADAVLALTLVPVAHRVAAEPFPAGSPPRIYWNSMFGVLNERLHELCRLEPIKSTS